MNYSIETKQKVVVEQSTTREVSLLEYIGHQVKVKREGAGLNANQLSKRLFNIGFNISSSTITRIERGEASLKILDLEVIAKFFKVKMGEFYPPNVLN